MIRQCALLETGLKHYVEGIKMQTEAWEKVSSGEWAGMLILLEHFPVVTIGREYEAEELLWPLDCYYLRGIELVRCYRDGPITCHNPGQLIGYPIINLSLWQQDSNWYVHSIEQVIINTIRCLGLPAERKQGYTGVWIDNRKIASIGVDSSRWITGHGFALNVNNDLSIFESIAPSETRELGVTSLLYEGITGLTKEAVSEVLIREFQQVFQCSFRASIQSIQSISFSS